MLVVGGKTWCAALPQLLCNGFPNKGEKPPRRDLIADRRNCPWASASTRLNIAGENFQGNQSRKEHRLQSSQHEDYKARFWIIPAEIISHVLVCCEKSDLCNIFACVKILLLIMERRRRNIRRGKKTRKWRWKRKYNTLEIVSCLLLCREEYES